MAASILKGALPRGSDGDRAGEELIATDERDYEHKAVRLVKDLEYSGHSPRGRLGDLRKMLWEGRWSSPLFDTRRWVRDLEEAYEIAWDRWVKGEGGDIWLERG
jgi:predicted O-linked N-acetylglucosamine transferase (SPINDLY family)